MKKSFLYITLLCSFLASGCSKEEGLPMPATDSPLVLQVNAEGFRTAAANTRASESELSTSFTEGDHIGVIITHPDGEMEHIVFTYKYGKWVAPNTVYYDSEARYSAYYPYRNAYNEKGLDEIKGLVEPLADQSDYATGYAFSDLMVCESASLNDERKLEINFAHAFSMLRMPCAVPMNIECANNDAKYVCDFKATDIIFDVGGTLCRPWIDADGFARLIVKSGSSPVQIKCSYTSVLGRKEATVTASNLTAGCYHTYSVPTDDYGKYEHYRIGDFFCKDAQNNWYVLPSEVKFDASQHQCIGIVFHAGRHEKDSQSDYTKALSEGGPCIAGNSFHGYVVALKNATDSYCMWGKYGTQLGLYPKGSDSNPLDNYNNPDIDWEGYRYTQVIITTAGGTDQLTADTQDGYPATYYAVVNYANQVPAPLNSSGWFLPAIGQMWQVYQQRENLRFTDVGGLNLIRNDYWSSSEYYNDPSEDALRVNVGYDDVYSCYKDRRYCYVRAVLAF